MEGFMPNAERIERVVGVQLTLITALMDALEVDNKLLIYIVLMAIAECDQQLEIDGAYAA
ncbi:hypothetical protein D3Y55_23860 [Mesorhizobium sp. DCY119]|nr:hypothetical protein D3Y55_23860 [Mesorhizobium sp. DCY119]